MSQAKEISDAINAHLGAYYEILNKPSLRGLRLVLRFNEDQDISDIVLTPDLGFRKAPAVVALEKRRRAG